MNGSTKKLHGNKWKWKHNVPKSLGCSKRGYKIGEVYSNTDLPQEARKIANKQPNLEPKGVRKQTNKQTKPNTSKRKEIIKITAGINDI